MGFVYNNAPIFFREFKRYLYKHILHVLISSLGLSIGIICCIAAYFWNAYNYEFDSVFKDRDVENIYTIHTKWQMGSGVGRNMFAPFGLGPALQAEVPSVRNYARYVLDGGQVIQQTERLNEIISFTDPSLFEIFKFEIIQGTSESISEPQNAIINQSMSRKLFGVENATGKKLKIQFENRELDFIITGVYKDMPQNSSFTVGIILNIKHYLDLHNLTNNDWSSWRTPTTFIELNNPEALQQIDLNHYLDIRLKAQGYGDDTEEYILTPFKAWFTEDEILGNYTNVRMSESPMRSASILAVILLFLACLNLTYVTIILSIDKARKIGIKRILGAQRQVIAIESIIESIMLVVLSLILALGISKILLPIFFDLLAEFNEGKMWTDLNFDISQISFPKFIIAILCIIFFSVITSGVYPMIYAKKIEPLALLTRNTQKRGSNIIVNSITTMQLACLVGSLTVATSFWMNSNYQENFDFGFNKEGVLSLKVTQTGKLDLFKKSVQNMPDVNVVGTTNALFGITDLPTKIELVGTGEYNVKVYDIGENFFEVFEMQITQGQGLSNSAVEGVVVNEKFVDLVGDHFMLNGQINLFDTKKRIVGVVANHIDNPYRQKEAVPSIFYIGQKPNSLLIKSNSPQQLDDLEANLEEKWSTLFPYEEFNSSSIENVFLGRARTNNQSISRFFLFITLISLILGLSQLISIIKFNVIKRTKEIAIKLILGSNLRNVAIEISHDLLVVIFIASITGGAAGYYASQRMLASTYINYYDPPLLVPIVSGTLVAVTGFVLSVVTTIKLANLNPVSLLRNE